MRNTNRTAITDWIAQTDWKLAITLTFKKDCTEHVRRYDAFGRALTDRYTTKPLKSKEKLSLHY